VIEALLEGQAAGFTIEQARQIQRTPVNALRRLPEIVSRAGISPAVWAVWPHPDGELIPLLDLAFVFGKEVAPSPEV
jgi:hypothetical protein